MRHAYSWLTPFDGAAMTDQPPGLRVLLLDPSLFTGPYNAGLTEGLLAAGVQPSWLTRPTRRGDRQEVPARYVQAIFYKHVDDALAFPKALRTLVKGLAHVVGLARMVGCVWRQRPDVIHVQWVVLPPLDLPVLWFLKRFCPLVLTVHDTVPFNGEHLSLLQNLGFHGPIRLADQVIVHTRAGKDTLVASGIDADKISVIAHGPLPLHARPQAPTTPRDPRWTFVVFGEIKPYKGIDVLIEALGLLPKEVLSQARVIVAGRARMDLTPLVRRLAELGLQGALEWRASRQSEQQMADLFAEADTFVFPYRQIDASGVYFLTKSIEKWIIASRVGIFAEDMQEGAQGALVPPEDAQALSEAMAASILRRPVPMPQADGGSWLAIGQRTEHLYRQVVQPQALGRSCAP